MLPDVGAGHLQAHSAGDFPDRVDDWADPRVRGSDVVEILAVAQRLVENELVQTGSATEDQLIAE